ncbi:MAG: hypothetical protein F4092_16960 [Rhodospirillaceae bacterium]|nr:hypothetical protein [Rhodospirillaceae bacterium]MDE0619221.1 hypothetical protein [Rhodospirillaceae bacterium]MYJ73416.1 hypothetical protein [Rhodospirillaceae bacterium]
MRSSSTLYRPDPARRLAPLGRFATVALAAGLLAACQSPALDSGDRFNRTASADTAASADDRIDGIGSADRSKRAIYGGLANQR